MKPVIVTKIELHFDIGNSLDVSEVTKSLIKKINKEFKCRTQHGDT